MSAICDAHKKKVDVELLYNSAHRNFNQLEIRCGRESQHPAEWALRPPIEHLQMLEWGTCPREAGSPGPRLSSPGGRERNAFMANRVGVNMLQFCSVSNSHSHTTLSIKWEVYFLKNCVARLYCVVVMILHAFAYEYTTYGSMWLACR